MTSPASAIPYRRLRAPQEHGQVLCEPELSSAGELVRQNTELTAAWDYDCQGKSLVQLSRAAREGLLQQAQAYTSDYRSVGSSVQRADAPVVLTGHQPWLFHPGVWFKNFALSAIGCDLGAWAVNLLIDNDVCPAAAIRVPSGTPSYPYLATVELDNAGDGVPFEERQVNSEDSFASFGRRTAAAISSLVEAPLVNRLWPHAVAAVRDTANLGRRLARARHSLESDWGLRSLELPLSTVCQSPEFFWFAAHLLAHLPRFWEIHNVSLAEYRHTQRVRSRSHPVPDLASDGPWIEAPFWIWTRDDPRRRRLFARIRGDEIELTDRARVTESIPLTPEQSAEKATEKLEQLTRSGLKLRPRALVTTMFSRMLLSDLFLHGIGGAKYDQLTDVLIQRFFGVQPPTFMTLTATAWLPIRRDSASLGDLRATDLRLRELRFHPERHIEVDDRVRTLIAEKQRWLQDSPAPSSLHERHLALDRVNRGLQPYLASNRSELLAQRERIVAGLRRNAIVTSREYAFCLFPEAELQPLLSGFCTLVPGCDGL